MESNADNPDFNGFDSHHHLHIQCLVIKSLISMAFRERKKHRNSFIPFTHPFDIDF